MRAWPAPEFVQQTIAQLPWPQIVTLLDKVKDPAARAGSAVLGPDLPEAE